MLALASSPEHDVSLNRPIPLVYTVRMLGDVVYLCTETITLSLFSSQE